MGSRIRAPSVLSRTESPPDLHLIGGVFGQTSGKSLIASSIPASHLLLIALLRCLEMDRTSSGSLSWANLASDLHRRRDLNLSGAKQCQLNDSKT